MKSSLNFIRDFVEVNEDMVSLEKLISLNVIEVEQMYNMVNATKLVIGEVLECVEHPDSDHLHVTKINLGDRIEQIVCGAPNCRAGIKVVVAQEGAVLPGNFKIKKSKVRGVESNGMCCSLQELGIDEKNVPLEFKDGIVILGDDAVAGESPLKYLGLDDVVIELGLTPNRGDLLSHLGIAYDIAAVKNEKVSVKLPAMKNAKPSGISVDIKTDDCKAYYARKITNIQIKESPWWLRSRLMACGVRPINNIVDITNYVMLELGQPLHAFDADIIGEKIVVRKAYTDEKMTTLDEIERPLVDSDIVITDGSKPIALGGVMGGLNSSINDQTVNLILESAYFDPIAIRKTASRLNLHSEASMRYERKVDPNRVLWALDRATELFGQLANADIDYAYVCVDNFLEMKKDKEILLAVDKVNNYLGINADEKMLTDIYQRLGFTSTYQNGIHTVMVPTRRVDISNYQDLLEEIARIYGYDKITPTLPVTDSRGFLTDSQLQVRRIRHYLAGLGLNETISYSLINKKDLNKFGNYTNEINLLMPMTEDHETLRQTLLNGMVSVLQYNKARQLNDVAVFEIGKGYDAENENLLLSMAMMGNFQTSLWQGKKETTDFFMLKGILEQLFGMLGYEAKYVKGVNPGLHNGQTAFIMVNDTKVGVIGALHPSILKENDLDNGYVLEISLSTLLDLKPNKLAYKPISKYPTVTRDLAIVIDRKIEVGEIMALVKQTAKKILVSANVFDLYQGDKIADNLKSVAISLVFRDDEKTLVSDDVDKMIKSILKRLEFTYQAALRQ